MVAGLVVAAVVAVVAVPGGVVVELCSVEGVVAVATSADGLEVQPIKHTVHETIAARRQPSALIALRSRREGTEWPRRSFDLPQVYRSAQLDITYRCRR